MRIRLLLALGTVAGLVSCLVAGDAKKAETARVDKAKALVEALFKEE